MIPEAKSDDLLARAQARLSDGDWNQAVALLETAGMHSDVGRDAGGELIEVLRTLVVSQRVVGNFIRRLGWDREDYRGFDLLEPGLRWDRAAGRLQTAVDDLPAAADNGLGQLYLAQDRYICADAVGAIDIAGRAARQNPDLAVACFYLSGLACRAANDLEQAKHFNRLLRGMISVSSSAYRLQAEIAEAAGDYQEARFMFDMALRMPDVPVTTALTTLDILLCQQDYRGYDIFFMKNRFVAARRGDGYFIYDRQRNRLVEVRSSVPSGVKRLLRRFLPDRWYEGLRDFNRRRRLYRILERRRPVDDFLESTTIERVMEMVDGAQDRMDTTSGPSSGGAQS